MSGSTSNKNKKVIISSKNVDEMKQDNIGQGELYSPDYSIKINTKNNQKSEKEEEEEQVKGNSMVGKGVANDIKNRMSMVKERLMEKLAATSVPSDALENAKHFFESVIKDVTSAAQGLTKEALQKIKSHLADIMPSLSPSLTSKMVDDSEKEAANREDIDIDIDKGKEIEGENNEDHKGKAYASPVSSFFSNHLVKPISRL